MRKDQPLFRQNFRVRSYEVGPDQNIRISHLINYLQDTAWNHTIKMGISIYDLQKQGLSWVLARKKIEILKIPGHRDEITVTTWPSGLEKYFFYRDFRINDGAGQELMRVTSTWLIFDMSTRKMVPVPDFMDSIPSIRGIDSMPVARDKILSVNKATFSTEYLIQSRDIDINRHTNNANYFQWIVESVHENAPESHDLKIMDIQFRAESRQADPIRILTEKIGNLSFIHQIINVNSGETLVLASTEWEET